MNAELLTRLIFWAGIGDLCLIVGSVWIPRVLGWREQTAQMRPLLRQVFWTYAGYIWTTNLSFGLLSTFAPASLTDRTTLAAAVSGFIALYWISRVVIQFAVFDRTDAPQGPLFRIAEGGLVALFVYASLVYSVALVWNLHLLGT